MNNNTCFDCEYYCDTPFQCPVLRTAKIESDENYLEFHFYCYFFKKHSHGLADDEK